MPTDPMAGAHPAAAWSLWVGSFGRGCVWTALALNLASLVLWLAAERFPRIRPLAVACFTAGCLAFVGALGSVMSLFVTDQFQYHYVFSHGSAGHKLQYKVAGTWSGQEGSILLWGTMSAVFGALSARATGDLRRWFTVVFAAFLVLVAAILAFESPFVLRPFVDGKVMVPTDGQGLNASLLNYWVVIHPPTIFAGFGSLTVLFAWSMAALATGNLTDWVQRVRPWALVSLSLLGVGLAMGGFWAYETLGWGGFWMWDPVENTSFVPWVGVAAFLHGIFVQVSRQKWHLANAFLGIVPFLLFCYGTFLTRSGYLGDTSVHSFAEMNRSALWLLVTLVLASAVAGITLWCFRALRAAKGAAPVRDFQANTFSRQGLFVIGIWLLVAAGVVTAVGMSVPFLMNVSGRKPRVVEEPVYNTVISFIYLPLTVVMALAPLVTWRGLTGRQLGERIINIVCVAMFLTGCTLLWSKSGWNGLVADFSATTKLLTRFPVQRFVWVGVLSFFAYFAMVASLWKLVEGRKSLSTVGGMLTHFGVSAMLFGLIFSKGFEQKAEGFVLTSHTPANALGYQLQALGPTLKFTDPDNKVGVQVTRGGQKFVVEPGLYFTGVDDAGQLISVRWPGIQNLGGYDFYLLLHTLTFDASGLTELKKDETRQWPEGKMFLTYKGLKTEGPLGQVGATFMADLLVTTPEGQFNVQPKMKVGENGMENTPAQVGSDYKVQLVRIDAASKSATLQIKYVRPAYVADLFYKPLTLLVWLGVGIMGLGGCVTAYARRYRPAGPKATTNEPGEEPESQENRHATEEVAQV